jgi:hypothetical protein
MVRVEDDPAIGEVEIENQRLVLEADSRSASDISDVLKAKPHVLSRLKGHVASFFYTQSSGIAVAVEIQSADERSLGNYWMYISKPDGVIASTNSEPLRLTLNSNEKATFKLERDSFSSYAGEKSRRVRRYYLGKDGSFVSWTQKGTKMGTSPVSSEPRTIRVSDPKSRSSVIVKESIYTAFINDSKTFLNDISPILIILFHMVLFFLFIYLLFTSVLSFFFPK